MENESMLIVNGWDEIGTVLKNTRLDQGKTRQDIVNGCNISLNTIGLVENNKVKPSFPTLHEWVKVLGYKGLCIRFHYESGDN